MGDVHVLQKGAGFSRLAWGNEVGVEPVPETERVLRRLGAMYGNDALAPDLRPKVERAAEVAPGLVGISLGLVRHGLTLTYLASDQQTATPDGVQYLDGGPCVQASHTGEVLHLHVDELIDEGRWQLFAR